MKSCTSGEEVLRARVVDGLFVLNQKRKFDMALLANDTLTLWHEHLGHINVQRLKQMRDNSATRVKFPDVELHGFFCEACALGKAHRVPIHHSPMTKCTVVGQELHWDVCGPMPPSLDGHTC